MLSVRAMKPILVRCSCCGGTGKQRLTRVLAETLAAIRPHVEVTAAEIMGRIADQLGHPAINNRLVTLEKLGLIVRVRKIGKEIIWKRK